MAGTFRCSIVTPTETVFDGDVEYASFPAWDGQHGVIPGQSPLLSQDGYGGLRLDLPAGESRWYLLEGGFAQVQDDSLTLLTNRATPADQLSLEEAKAELAEANARVTTHVEDRAPVERDQQRALAKKMLAEAELRNETQKHRNAET